MKRIVGLIYPFTKEQTFAIYDNDKRLATVHPTIDKIPETVMRLA